MKRRLLFSFLFIATACAPQTSDLRFHSPLSQKNESPTSDAITPTISGSPTPTPNPAVYPWFDKLKAQVLEPNCVKCHQPPKPKAKVNLTSYEAIMNSQDPKDLIVPHHPELSDIYQEIDTQDMPPKDDMPEAGKEAIRKWIEAGAPKEIPASEYTPELTGLTNP